MYISKNNGKTWTPPIVIHDTFMDDRDAGIVYLGNGKLVVSWFTHSAFYYQNKCCEQIHRDAGDNARQMVTGALEDYKVLPNEARKGGSYLRISEDYGVTWGEIIRVPVSEPHGPNVCKDGTLIYLVNKMYEDTVNLGDNTNAFCISTDGGKTWEEEYAIDTNASDGDLGYPATVELDDGSLLTVYYQKVPGDEKTSLIYTKWRLKR